MKFRSIMISSTLLFLALGSAALAADTVRVFTATEGGDRKIYFVESRGGKADAYYLKAVGFSEEPMTRVWRLQKDVGNAGHFRYFAKGAGQRWAWLDYGTTVLVNGSLLKSWNLVALNNKDESLDFVESSGDKSLNADSIVAEYQVNEGIRDDKRTSEPAVLADLEKACGKKITVKINEAQLKALGYTKAQGFAAASGVSQLCGKDADYKTAVQAYKSIVVGAENTPDLHVKKSGAELTIVLGSQSFNLRDLVSAEAEKSL